MSAADRILAAWRLWRATRLLRASNRAWAEGRRHQAGVLLARAGDVLAKNRATIG